MPQGFDSARARQYLRAFDLVRLFIEVLGWDRPGSDVTITLGGGGEGGRGEGAGEIPTLLGEIGLPAPSPLQEIHMTAIAQKRGLAVLVCPPFPDGCLPDHATRRKIEAQVRKQVHEHLIIFTNTDRSLQKWQWVRREPGRPAASREFDYVPGQKEESLLQRLQHAVFSFEEEESIDLLGVTSRVRAAFDVEKVTKRFYERFQSEHDAFMAFLEGIPDEGLQRWYVSVTLNRLMFVYFIQKKQFLGGDPDYLRTKLTASMLQGPDRYYRDVLCPLFFEGFAMREGERSPAINRLLGRVPYLNGGIFARHQLEERYGQSIQIADAAFERLFDFFDQYRWHLDERPLRADNEINPDVLGYIFEKYINQKQMGAYYTKEDITGYISKYTVLPFLLDQARSSCKIAFEGPQSVWRLLSDDPDRYIYPAVRHGAARPLPAQIAAGLDPPTLRQPVSDGPVPTLELRRPWNHPAPADYALPTEIWREVVARRARYEELRGKLARGEVHEVNDLITDNLDIQQFAQDVVEGCEGPELLRACWKALLRVKILDPTCGSGAFLFAALNILEPLYEGCLERMQGFLDELERGRPALLERAGGVHRPEKMSDFRDVLADVARHPNRRYYILKTIIVHNLYGVDIMDEAVEICKLRLFLKLVAQVERAQDIEPLPDIDFNIRAGNTLVGFTALDEVQRALTTGPNGQMFLPTPEITAQLARLQEQAEVADRAYQQFQAQQVEQGTVTPAAKAALRARLDALNQELNHALAHTYGIDPDGPAYGPWLASHKPFHWLSDFYGIMQGGGFDVIIGNPPYVEYSRVRCQYTLPDTIGAYSTNLYSACCYRAHQFKHKSGYAGLIVPISLPSTDRMQPLRDALLQGNSVHFVSFSTRPCKLFEGAEQRLTVYLQSPSREPSCHSGGYLKWLAGERSHLFAGIYYVGVSPLAARHNLWPKARGPVCQHLVSKMLDRRTLRKSGMLGSGRYLYYKNTGIRYFSTVTLRAPKCWINGVPSSSSRETTLSVGTDYIHIVHCLLLSTTFFVYYEVMSNCRDLNPSDLYSFPAPSLSTETAALNDLSLSIEADYTAKGKIVQMQNRLTGTVILESLTPAVSKPILDEIDTVLARHYGFSEEELDFIINYDIKYRMGAELEGEEGE